MSVDRPKWVIAGFAAGLLATLVIAFAVVLELQGQAVEEALAEQGGRLESHLRTVVEEFAEEAFGSGGGGLETFGKRIVSAVEGNPRIRDVTVLTPERMIVAKWSRDGEPDACWRIAPLDRLGEQQHPAASDREGPRGCLAIPVFANGTHRGAVVVHSDRVWLAEGKRAERLVRLTSMRLAPVFLGFSLLLGALLLLASNAARRWRMRAASMARVEALGAIADGINHEIKNPLNAVALSLQYLERRYDEDAETREVVGSARREARAISDTIEEFVRFTKVAKLDCAEVSIAERLRRVGCDIRGEVRAAVDPIKLDAALDAVLGLFEAYAAGDERPAVVLESSGRTWRMTIEAATPGLDRELVDRLFDPYLRTRARDVGRGLAFARAVFQAHGGDLGARFRGGRLRLRGDALLDPPGGER